MSLRPLAFVVVAALACEREAPAPPPEPAPIRQPALAPQPEQDKRLAAPTADLPPPRARDASFRRGVSLGLFVSTREPVERRRLYRMFLDEIAQVGATDVQLVVQWSQLDARAMRIAPLPGVSPPDELLAWIIDEAHARSLRVFLLPILHLQTRPRGEWRGELAPLDWDAWWRSYRAFILHYARLARRHRVELYAVGSELISTESQDARWRSLIAEVRKRFHGQLTYSANWDHFEPVQFWDALDVAGITGYQELARAPRPDEQTLVDGFRGLRQRVHRWAASQGLRFVFTEIGYASQPGAARHPWDYRVRGAADPGLQLLCYRALYRAWHADPYLAGLYIWNWFGEGGPADTSYTPRGKPAEAVLRQWYTGSLRQPP